MAIKFPKVIMMATFWKSYRQKKKEKQQFKQASVYFKGKKCSTLVLYVGKDQSEVVIT